MKFKIQTRPDCKWCLKAKKLMGHHNIDIDEEVFDTDARRAWFKENVADTFPQIYGTDGQRIGGYLEFEQWVIDNLL